MTDTSSAGKNGAGQDDLELITPPPLVVNAQYVKDFSFENPNVLDNFVPNQKNPDIQINLSVQANGVQPDLYEVSLIIRAEAKRGDRLTFLVELAYAGIFTLKDYPQELVQPVLFIEAPRLLFPFARQIVADATREGGYPPLLINPIDFVDLYRRRQAEQQAQGAGGQPVGAA